MSLNIPLIRTHIFIISLVHLYKCTREIQNIWMLILRYIQLQSMHYINNIVWLSLIWDTDWLNTVTWLTNISVCCPPQSCGGGTLIDTTKCFHSGKIFTQTNGKMGLRYYRFKHVCWPPLLRTGCLLRAQYNGYALHCGAQYNGYALYCAQLKGNPRWKKILSFVNFYKLCRSRAR